MKTARAPEITIGFRVGRLVVASDTGERKNGYRVWQCRCDCGGLLCLDTRTLQRGTVTDCGCATRVGPRQKDLTGQRFGRLTVVEPTPERGKNGATVWKCRCDCGQETLAVATQLTQGYKKSCGCLGKPGLKDYVGRRFGRLVVTAYAGKSGGMHRWQCRCDCGGTTVVGQTLLQSGKTKSCGCLAHPPAQPLQGRRFGRLTVLSFDGNRGGKYYWRCQCDCGREAVVAQTNLLRGRTKSCGCLQAGTLTENRKLVDGTSVALLEKTPGRLVRSNTSGHNGVYFNRRSEKWAAQIGFKGKTYYLGSFENIEDAVAARQEAEKRIYGGFLEWYYKTHPRA